MDYKTLMLTIGGVAFFIAMVMLFTQKSKKSITATKASVMFAVVFLVIGLIPFFGIANYGSGKVVLNAQPGAIGNTGTQEEIPQTTPDTSADIYGCDLSATITYTLAGQDAYNGSAVGGTHRYRINGGTWQTLSDAGTFSGSPNQQLDVLWENGATGGYFSKYESYKLPCSVNTFSPKLYINGSITSTVKDDAGTVIALATNNQTISNGDKLTSKVILKGTYETAFPYGFDAVVEFNNSALDDVKLLVKDSSTEYPMGIEPQSYVEYWGSTSSTKTYSLPALVSLNNLEFDVLLDADDSHDPTADGYGEGNITISYYPKNIFVNEDKGGIGDGPRSMDEDSALTRTGTTGAGISTIYYD